jgi:hypothetical protein
MFHIPGITLQFYMAHDQQTLILVCFQLFSLLHRACCRVTQLLHQPLHIYKIYKNLHIKTLITFRHVS